MSTRLLDLVSVNRRLFAAIGLSPLLVAGCSEVLVVDDDGEGGQGGTGKTTNVVTQATTTSGPSTQVSTGAGFTCETQGVVYACNEAAQGPCPAAGSQEAIAMMNEVLAKSEICSPGATGGSGCTCDTWVFDAPCGPDPNAVTGCCYFASTQTNQTCMTSAQTGRPFSVQGTDRTAGSARRTDWFASIDVCAEGIPMEERRALASLYRRDARYEHASVASFARFALELMALGAPARLVRASQQAMADEIRHAELCFGIAASLDGDHEGPGPIDIAGALDGRSDPITILEAVILEGCVGETLSALIALAARDAATDEGVRAALDEIAKDELSHAELAWSTIAWARAEGTPEIVEAIDAMFARALPQGDDMADPDLPADRLHHFGRLTRGERNRIMTRGFEDVVRPLAAALRAGGEVAIPVRTAGRATHPASPA